MTKSLYGLYAITDASLIAEKKFNQTIEQALAGGVKIIQYRDKSKNTEKRYRQAHDLKHLCDQYNATFIINDDIDLTKTIDADGVHIGSSDRSYKTARETLGEDKIIGVSCYNQFELAQQAQQQGANYVAFGRFFSSSIKPDAVIASTELLIRAKQELSIPVCAIGGITLNNSDLLIKTGADMLAVITAVFSSANIESTCQKFCNYFVEKNNE